MNLRVMSDADLPGSTGAASREARFGLLADLKYLTVAFLAEALQEGRAEVLSAEMARLLALYLEAGQEAVAALHRAAWQLGLQPSGPPEIDLASGFTDLGREAGIQGLDPFSCETAVVTGVLVLNSLSQAVVAAWLGEDATGIWRSVLPQILADDARFEDLLDAAMMCSNGGRSDDERAGELRALIGGPLASTSSGEPLWSFDLLSMAISRVACGGSPSRHGGFFPTGMSGFRRQWEAPPD
jgi:hypothetical protein